MTPTYITFKNPHGGLGLRARTAAKAIERIEGLFAACAADLRLETVSLRVGDPCSPAMAADLGNEHLDGGYSAGGTTFSVAAVGGLTFDEPDDDFVRAYEKVNQGLGMKLPAKALRVDSATKGGDRKWNKLPPWEHG